MKSSDFIKETAAKTVKQVNPQNIDQLKEQCYRCASDSIAIRTKLNESKLNVDPWVAKKIAMAQECLEAVKKWIKDAELLEDASAGAMGAASVAAVATPLLKKRKVIKRNMKEAAGTLPPGPSSTTIKPVAATKPLNPQNAGADDPAETGAIEKIINDPILKQDLDALTSLAKGNQPTQDQEQNQSQDQQPGQEPDNNATQPELLDKQTLELIKANPSLKNQYDQLIKKAL